MTSNARNLFRRLAKDSRFRPYLYDRSEYGAHFIIGAEALGGDAPLPPADYYGEFRNDSGDPWVHPQLEAAVHTAGCYVEWINAGMLGVYDA